MTSRRSQRKFSVSQVLERILNDSDSDPGPSSGEEYCPTELSSDNGTCELDTSSSDDECNIGQQKISKAVSNDVNDVGESAEMTIWKQKRTAPSDLNVNSPEMLAQMITPSPNIQDNLDASAGPSRTCERQTFQQTPPLSSVENLSQNVDSDVSDNIMTGVQRGRRPERWLDNVRKRKRNMGEGYTSRKGKIFRPREVKSGCGKKCKFNCHDKITRNEREHIFHQYWQIGCVDRQRQFLCSAISQTPIKRRRKTSNSDSRRKFSLKYNLTVRSSKTMLPEAVRVCKKFFLDTLGVSETVIHTAVKKKSSAGVVSKDKRGTHNKHKKIDEVLRRKVRAHINSFSRVPSHYCRRDTKKQYLDSNLNLRQMYRLYKAESRTKEQPFVKEHLYRQIFSTDFNLGFHVPKKDTCSLCEKYKNSSHGEKSEMKQIYDRHLQNKSLSRALKGEQKERAKTDNAFSSACFDMEQVLQCPRGTNNLFYYKRKLSIYNLTIYDFKQSEVFCYMWNETTSSRGSCEVASCIYNFLKSRPENIKEVSLFCDNCGGQNKNCFVMAMLVYSSLTSHVHEISLNFLEKGHTENENDSVHAAIERAARYYPVYVPEQYYTLVRSARRTKTPYTVKEMGSEDFFDFQILCSVFKNTKIDEENNQVKWREIRQLFVSKSTPEMVEFTYDYDGRKRSINLFRRSRIACPSAVISEAELKYLHTEPLPISESKAKDLVSLCEVLAIPKPYHQFYDNLPRKLATDDSASECSSESDRD